jgi:hypothetical protein
VGYLAKFDYKTYIQADYLRQLTQADDSKRVIEERNSMQAIIQRLTQKYDLDSEFTDTVPYDATRLYGAAQRVYIDVAANGFSAWTASTAYTAGNLVVQSGVGYICTTANSDATFTAANWQAVGNQYDVFYASYPATCTLAGQPNVPTLTEPYAPVFNYKNPYTKGDIVFWKGATYVCVQDSMQVTHQAAIQYTTYNNIPFANVFPDDPIANVNGMYWNTKTAYAVPAGTLFPPVYNATNSYAAGAYTSHNGATYVCTGTTTGAFDPTKWTALSYWIAGDNRNQTVKDAMVRITVFKLSPLIAPKNTPEVWLADYRSMLHELNEAAEGNITMLLPPRQPQTGLKTLSGSEVKRVNNY